MFRELEYKVKILKLGLAEKNRWWYYMKNNIVEDLEQILKDKNSSPQDRTLAICMLEIRNRLIYLERLSKLQVALLSSLIAGVITIAVFI